MQKAKRLYQDQEATIADLRDCKLFNHGRYVQAPPDFKQEYANRLASLNRIRRQIQERAEEPLYDEGEG